MTEQQETPVTNQENTAAPAETPVETPQQPTEQQPAVLIPPSQRQISPKARMISRLIGTLITVTILAVVIYMEFAGDKKSQSTASKQATPEQLIAQLEKIYTQAMMGVKPSAIKHLQGDEYAVWLDQNSGEPDVKIKYDRKKNKFMLPQEGLSQEAKAKINNIRCKALSEYIFKEFGKKPFKVAVGAGKNQYDVWMDPDDDSKSFTMSCKIKNQTWHGTTDNDQALFKAEKDLAKLDK
jgi:hypothetical protein